MKDLKSTRGALYIRKLIEEGEHEHQDFKFAIKDARKIARSLSAFANNSGGRLLVGVKDNGVVAGLRSEEDVYVVEQAAELYCRPTPTLHFATFRVEGGAVVLRVDIEAAVRRPVRASEPDGSWRAYYRVADENIVAHALMVRGWQQAASDRGAIVTLGSDETRLLDIIDADGYATSSGFARLSGLSQQRADAIVVSLYAMGVIDFAYRDGGFVVVAKASESL